MGAAIDTDKLTTDIMVLEEYLIGKAFNVKAGLPLDQTTYVAPSQVIPRQKRLSWWAKKIFGEYKPQRERGLFANKSFKKGDYIGNYDGIIVDKKYLSKLDASFDYVIWPSIHSNIGILGYNPLRRSNHQPEARANMSLIGLSFYASADIKPGDEMTWPYIDREWDAPTSIPLGLDGPSS